MKTHKVLFLALIVSAVLALSVEAADRRGNNNGRSQVAPSRGRASVSSFSSGPGFRSGSGRMIGSATRFSSIGPRSMPSSFRQRSTFNSGGNVGSFNQRQFTRRTLSNGNGLANFQNNRSIQTNRFAQIQGQRGNRFAQFGTPGGNRTIGNISPGHNHVFSQRSLSWHRDWDRHSDHFWNGHRCRFVNGSWFIFDIGFIPWFGWPYSDYYAYDYYYPYGYGGYGYGAYGYDSGAYDQSNYYDQGGYDSSYNDQRGYNNNGQSNYDNQRGNNYNDQGRNGSRSSDQSAAVTVADVQDQLARAGYYRGKIDGVLGPETRHALLRYQSAKGLRMTGSLTTETQQSLGLAAQGGDQITDQ